jgi:hypothetical protein
MALKTFTVEGVERMELLRIGKTITAKEKGKRDWIT